MDNSDREMHRFIWDPMKWLNANNSCPKLITLILNQPITLQRSLLLSLWDRAHLRITVDGGTNHWFEFTRKERCKLPDFITGDLDSVKDEVLEFYRQKDVCVVRTPDQNQTDFTKAVAYAIDHAMKNDMKIDGLVAVVQPSGRLDHTLGNINTLFLMANKNKKLPVYLLCGDCLSWLLEPGFHEIVIPQDLILKNKWCGLIPVGSRANSVTTTGLKWNLDARTLEFGACVSTSNAYNGDPVVTIRTDSCLLWTMGLVPVDGDS